MQKEKVRVYALAREMNIESKDLLDMCRQLGFDVKNQLSNLEPEHVQAIEELVKKGGSVAVAAAPALKTAPRSVAIDNKVRTITPPKAAPQARPTPAGRGEAAESPIPHEGQRTAEPGQLAAEGPAQPPKSEHVPEAPGREPLDRPIEVAPLAAQVATPPATAHEAPPIRKLETGTVPPAPQPSTAGVSPAAAQAPAAPVNVRPPVPNMTRPPGVGAPRTLTGGSRPGGTAVEQPKRQRSLPRPTRSISVAAPPTLKPRPVEEKRAQAPTAQKKLMDLPDAVKRGEKAVGDVHQFLKEVNKAPAAAPAGEIEGEDEDSSKARPGKVAGRGDRHEKRAKRAEERKGRAGETKILLGDDDGPVRGRLRRKKHAHQHDVTRPRERKIVLTHPITIRAFCEATGVRAVDVLFKLKDLGLLATINSTIDEETAQLIALDKGFELEIKRQHDAEEIAQAQQEKPDNPEDLVPRAPIVTIMGHVDHGKTTLLDKIRESDVAATEAGGITQVLRAWRVEHGGRPITFLDTPGHEAFTKMRARGANVTDIAVIVVAVDDGVMPQTEEAISHAKAAGVSLIVALNKVDLPNANVRKTEQQLYGLGLVPDNMGGDVPFVQTSGAKGIGIETLLDTISVMAELKELKANPKKPAHGTVLEAMLSEGEGVLATLLVRDGTLHKGDVFLCGSAYGRARALYNDLGMPIQEAGPSTPVRITGLDEMPNADDPFQVAEDLSVAREIADKRRIRTQEASMKLRPPVRLETLTEAKIDELKLILKADFRGSVEAITKELQKLKHDEVCVRILHAAIGGITESDVQLALASPEDTIIVGFNVVPDDNARSLADARGIQIREYDIIYKLTEDIRAALEGKLKPREEIVHLGRAVVRETFKISRTGTIAGCYVTQGVIERSAKVRIIRDGVVIYPPTDRSVGLDSLKRFKEDAREVREGFECGLKISGYDDVKVGDVIEAYRVEHVQRTL